MGRKATWSVVALAVMLALPAAVSAQVESLKDFQASDAQQMGEKFVQLAQAFDESQYDWAPPMPEDNVRSVRGVLALAVAEANLFPRMWGATPPQGVGQGFGPEIGRVMAMDKAAVIAELEKAFAYMSSSLESMSDEQHMADGTTFGRQMSNAAGISLAMSDMHEHLGQLIAYARTNKVVPPWSAGD